MTNRSTPSIDAGSPDYWKDRQRAFRLIREAELALQRHDEAPQYLHGGFDENDDVIAIENLAPEDDVIAAVRAIEADPTAVSILAAQGRTRIGWCRVDAVVRRLIGS
ncbi:hypothetical protein [Paracoccus versutus]|uniref:Uncharacterized protein n=1 Tax=Paracoccus versutus TaxID=34007 RepID=A0A3D9XAR2_PARVE|nr:hypothetical protein [Paracoccus versutus]REF66731.1 hypothetical protein BDD41_4986 [Paracoccus versutus]WGR56452.1 hypothetical protein E3U25_10965 [Paracoccus versutus]